MSRFAGIRALIRERGARGAMDLAMHRAYSAHWERRLGVSTGGDHLLQDEGLVSPEFQDHSASSVLDLQRALSLVTSTPAQDVFVDFGSGKGRALLVAASRPFRRVIGVELSPHLTRIARQNIDRARPHLRCLDVQVETMGADQFEIPGDATLLYFYNPFTGSVMARVVENLRRSLVSSPREVTVVFAGPRHFDEAVAGQSWVSSIRGFNGLRHHVLYRCATPQQESSGT